MSYLKKRHNTWYARMGIPNSARPFIGRNEFVQSLQTQSRAIAERRVLAYVIIDIRYKLSEYPAYPAGTKKWYKGCRCQAVTY